MLYDFLYKIHTLTAVIHQEDDLYVAQCPEIGTVSQGSTVEEAVTNLKEATELYLEEFPNSTPCTGKCQQSHCTVFLSRLR
jgi:predicted RNase H-like HicB family nuclease